MVLGSPWRPRHRVYTMYRPPGGHIRPSPRRAAGMLELRCGRRRQRGSGVWGRPTAPAGQPPGGEMTGYDPQVVCTSCTLGPVASREVLVPLYIDCTRCTRFVYALHSLYTFCNRCQSYGISIDFADHMNLSVTRYFRGFALDHSPVCFGGTIGHFRGIWPHLTCFSGDIGGLAVAYAPHK